MLSPHGRTVRKLEAVVTDGFQFDRCKLAVAERRSSDGELPDLDNKQI